MNGSKGQATVEFALTFAIFIAVLLGLFDGGRVIWAHAALQKATHAAAVYASKNIIMSGKSRSDSIKQTLSDTWASLGGRETVTVEYYNSSGTLLASPGSPQDYLILKTGATLALTPIGTAIALFKGRTTLTITSRELVYNDA